MNWALRHAHSQRLNSLLQIFVMSLHWNLCTTYGHTIHETSVNQYFPY